MRVRQFQARRVKLPLQIVLANLDVAKGHTQTLVTEEFLEGGEAYTGPQQFRGIRVSPMSLETNLMQRDWCDQWDNSRS